MYDDRFRLADIEEAQIIESLASDRKRMDNMRCGENKPLAGGPDSLVAPGGAQGARGGENFFQEALEP